MHQCGASCIAARLAACYHNILLLEANNDINSLFYNYKCKYKAVVFDMDGTLIDSERTRLNLWGSIASGMGHPFSIDSMIRTIGTTNEDTIKMMLVEYPDAPHDNIRKKTSDRYREMREKGEIALRPGARDALEKVRGFGLQIGLCTSTNVATALMALKFAGIQEFFDVMVCGNEVKCGKPNPEPYLLAAQRLGIDPTDCLVIEDSPSGARSALSAGMAVAVVPDLIPVPADVARNAAVFDNIALAVSTLLI